jgi:hypothetical protein
MDTLQPNFTYGNIVINAGLFGLVLWFIRRWINGVECSLRQNKKDTKESTSQIAMELAEKTKVSFEILSVKVDTNKAIYTQTYSDLKDRILESKASHDTNFTTVTETLKKVFDLQREQNSNVATVKVDLAAQVSFCNAINNGKLKGDK